MALDIILISLLTIVGILLGLVWLFLAPKKFSKGTELKKSSYALTMLAILVLIIFLIYL